MRVHDPQVTVDFRLTNFSKILYRTFGLKDQVIELFKPVQSRFKGNLKIRRGINVAGTNATVFLGYKVIDLYRS